MKILQVAVLVVSMTMFSPTVVSADGNQLLKDCLAAVKALDTQEMTNDFGQGRCFGLTKGVMETIDLVSKISSDLESCFPKVGMTYGQYVRIVTKYLQDHPEELQSNESILILSALGAAYPCN